MPVKGGNKRRKGKKTPSSRNLILADESQGYGFVIEKCGGAVPIMKLKLTSGKKMTGSIRGKMRKKVWVNIGDVVLISTRDFQENRVDIIGVYDSDQVRKLIKKGEFCASFPKNEELNSLIDDNIDIDEESDHSDDEFETGLETQTLSKAHEEFNFDDI